MCEDGSCATDLSLCTNHQCEDGELKCWDGKCVSDPEMCSTRPICPPSAPTMCADGTCVNSLLDCADPIKCPAHSSY
jgi:hypothetical protein